MRKTLLSFVAIAAGSAMAMAQAEPAFPATLDFTINGEKGLSGVTVTQKLDGGSPEITASGKTAVDQVTFTFATPQGWDGLMIMAPFGDVSENEFTKTRSEDDWLPIASLAPMGFIEGNSVTFTVEEEPNYAEIALIKGGMAYQSHINLDFNVTKGAGTGDQPGGNLVFPEKLTIDTFNEGLEVWQGEEWGSFVIKVNGEVAANKFSIVIDTPQGWDGLISKIWGNEGEVSIEENDQTPRGTRAEEDVELEPMSELGDEFIKGNRFTFETSYTPESGNYHTVEIRLYKGDMVTVNDITLEVYVTKGEIVIPPIPESFNISSNVEGLKISQEDGGYYGTTISVEGECTEKEFDLIFEVPEGWSGFVGATAEEINQESTSAMKAPKPSSLLPIEEAFEMGLRKTNTLTFHANGETQQGYLFLYISDQYDYANLITVYSKVKQADPTAVPTDFEVKQSSATRYYNLQGAEVANPKPGVYVKVVDGKASKVIIK